MTTKKTLLKAIRKKCYDCSCFQPSEITLCPVTRRPIHPFRSGKDPTPAKRGFAKNSSSSRTVFDSKKPSDEEGSS